MSMLSVIKLDQQRVLVSNNQGYILISHRQPVAAYVYDYGFLVLNNIAIKRYHNELINNHIDEFFKENHSTRNHAHCVTEHAFDTLIDGKFATPYSTAAEDWGYRRD
jgi:hypothetical protein